MHTSSSEETPRSQSMNDSSMAIIFASSRSSLEAPWNDREPRTHPTWGNRPARVHFQLRPGAPLDVGRGADSRSLASLARRAPDGHLRESLATEQYKDSIQFASAAILELGSDLRLVRDFRIYGTPSPPSKNRFTS